MLKKLALFAALAAMFCVFAIPALAGWSYNVDVLVNGKAVNFPDQKPFIDDNVGRTYVPLRFVSEALGAAVTWDTATQEAVVSRNGTWVYMPVNSSEARVDTVNPQFKQKLDEPPNIVKTVSLDAPALLVNDRTMVPLRFISEALGAKVEWQAPAGGQNGKVIITDAAPAPEPPKNEGGKGIDPIFEDATIIHDGGGEIVELKPPTYDALKDSPPNAN